MDRSLPPCKPIEYLVGLYQLKRGHGTIYMQFQNMNSCYVGEPWTHMCSLSSDLGVCLPDFLVHDKSYLVCVWTGFELNLFIKAGMGNLFPIVNRLDVWIGQSQRGLSAYSFLDAIFVSLSSSVNMTISLFLSILYIVLKMQTVRQLAVYTDGAPIFKSNGPVSYLHKFKKDYKYVEYFKEFLCFYLLSTSTKLFLLNNFNFNFNKFNTDFYTWVTWEILDAPSDKVEWDPGMNV